MHFSASDGFVGVLDEDIALYKINFEWLTQVIMSALEMPKRRQATSILTDHIWTLGEHRLVKKRIAIILTRGIHRSIVFGTLRAHLKDNHSARDPALGLSMDRHHPEHLQLPRQNTLVRFREVLVMERERFEINLPLLEVKLGGQVSRDGFSSGYRVLTRNGEEFYFSKRQADVMEYLHKEGGPRHRDEILAAVNNPAKRMVDVFRKGGKPIPAWGTVIKHDNRGYYHLDL